MNVLCQLVTVSLMIVNAGDDKSDKIKMRGCADAKKCSESKTRYKIGINSTKHLPLCATFKGDGFFNFLLAFEKTTQKV